MSNQQQFNSTSFLVTITETRLGKDLKISTIAGGNAAAHNVINFYYDLGKGEQVAHYYIDKGGDCRSDQPGPLPFAIGNGTKVGAPYLVVAFEA
jgi:hypothetical protein